MVTSTKQKHKQHTATTITITITKASSFRTYNAPVPISSTAPAPVARPPISSPPSFDDEASGPTPNCSPAPPDFRPHSSSSTSESAPTPRGATLSDARPEQQARVRSSDARRRRCASSGICCCHPVVAATDAGRVWFCTEDRVTISTHAHRGGVRVETGAGSKEGKKRTHELTGLIHSLYFPWGPMWDVPWAPMTHPSVGSGGAHETSPGIP